MTRRTRSSRARRSSRAWLAAQSTRSTVSVSCVRAPSGRDNNMRSAWRALSDPRKRISGLPYRWTMGARRLARNEQDDERVKRSGSAARADGLAPASSQSKKRNLVAPRGRAACVPGHWNWDLGSEAARRASSATRVLNPTQNAFGSASHGFVQLKVRWASHYERI